MLRRQRDKCILICFEQMNTLKNFFRHSVLAVRCLMGHVKFNKTFSSWLRIAAIFMRERSTQFPMQQCFFLLVPEEKLPASREFCSVRPCCQTPTFDSFQLIFFPSFNARTFIIELVKQKSEYSEKQHMISQLMILFFLPWLGLCIGHHGLSPTELAKKKKKRPNILINFSTI